MVEFKKFRDKSLWISGALTIGAFLGAVGLFLLFHIALDFLGRKFIGSMAVLWILWYFFSDIVVMYQDITDKKWINLSLSIVAFGALLYELGRTFLILPFHAVDLNLIINGFAMVSSLVCLIWCWFDMREASLYDETPPPPQRVERPEPPRQPRPQGGAQTTRLRRNDSGVEPVRDSTPDTRQRSQYQRPTNDTIQQYHDLQRRARNRPREYDE